VKPRLQPSTAIPPPGPHGGDGARVAAALGLHPDQVLDLSASLNPFAPDVPALARRHLGALGRYPDVEAAEAHLAAGLGVPADRLVLTAGGAQAIALVAEQLEAGWVEDPEFSLYRRHLRRIDPGAARWRSDPHNPSGRLAGSSVEAGDARDRDGVPAVWDEAFLPLSAGVWTRGRPGWAVGSLTKAFACPGLRLGYALAPSGPEAAQLRQRRPAWAVGALACAVLPELMERADPPGWTRRIRSARADLDAVLRQHGWRPLPSEAPWLLVPEARGLRERLAPEGVIVRDCASFGLTDHVRIAVPGDRGLEQLDLALIAAGGSARTRG
jgi:histidinol-phosphate/aromatic aminotransferase/cobyric acid decarboxylase-like protein